MNASNQHEISFMELNDIRVYDPRDYEYSPQFDFDYLFDVEDTKQPEMTRCRCDDSEPHHYLTCCTCGIKELEYYGYRYKSSTYCNECAFKVCGKLIEKPKFAFARLKEDKIQFTKCHLCDCDILWEDKIFQDGKIRCYSCDYDADLLNQYSEEQQNELINYAKIHNLTIEESIDYQTHCHCCGNEVQDGVFDEKNHQYCKKICFEHCEEYRYDCSRGEECKVCEIWAYRTRCDSLTAYDIELSDCAPVLATIDCFKELQVYGQLYECIEDLVEYFDSDRQWRYGL